MHHELDDPRRRALVQALSAGVFSAAIPLAHAQVANIFGSRPARLPPDKSVYRISGEATVNDKPATLDTKIVPGDTVKTGKNSELVMVVNSNAMILRGGTNVTIEREEKSSSLIITGLRLLSGALLSVSRNQPTKIRTANATIGIRGTGFYIEAEANESYFCLCYGAAKVEANDDRQSSQDLVAKYHDRPIFITNDAKNPGKNIRTAPFKNHTDQELTLIETLVGRTPPFGIPKDNYTTPRRNY